MFSSRDVLRVRVRGGQPPAMSLESKVTYHTNNALHITFTAPELINFDSSNTETLENYRFREVAVLSSQVGELP